MAVGAVPTRPRTTSKVPGPAPKWRLAHTTSAEHHSAPSVTHWVPGRAVTGSAPAAVLMWALAERKSARRQHAVRGSRLADRHPYGTRVGAFAALPVENGAGDEVAQRAATGAKRIRRPGRDIATEQLTVRQNPDARRRIAEDAIGACPARQRLATADDIELVAAAAADQPVGTAVPGDPVPAPVTGKHVVAAATDHVADRDEHVVLPGRASATPREVHAHTRRAPPVAHAVLAATAVKHVARGDLLAVQQLVDATEPAQHVRPLTAI